MQRIHRNKYRQETAKRARRVAVRHLEGFAAEHRRCPTKAERDAWKMLNDWLIEFKQRNIYIRSNVSSIKLLRQEPLLQKYIVDFYLPFTKTIIEIDGPYHQDQIKYDKQREYELTRAGYKIVRFANEQVYGKEFKKHALKLFQEPTKLLGAISG